jgi:transglutaminase-like putative cysteine protease
MAAAVAAAGVAGALGFGMTVAQRFVEAQVLDYFRDRAALASRADRARTAIGDLGTLEQSGRIVLRVEASPASRPPRLRDGVFDTYQSGVWYAPVSPMRSIPPVGTDSWVLDARSVPHRARISLWLEGGRGSLPVPEGTARLDALNAGLVQAAAHGTVLVAQSAEFLDFTAGFDGTSLADGPPTPRDLSVPSRLASVLQRVAEEAGVAALPPSAAVARLRAHFQEEFAYTVRLGADGITPRPLEAFLTTDRRGHCEYFATAATLVLRQLGIPARYVTGYAVEEWSDREGAFVVRARDGHAWTEAWVDGRWQTVDATPPAWRALETAESSVRPVRDTLSWLFHRFTG